MHFRRILAVGGAIAAFALISVATALAAGTGVSVRVEGLRRTLLPATVVHTHSGSITKGGTPPGVCPASSAAGALDVATHGRWDGSYSAGFGLSVTRIFGESHPFTPPKYYWSFWVNNRYASSGACGVTVHPGENVLFAAVSDKGTPFPLVLSAPRHATAGQAFRVKVFYFDAKAHAKPLSGVRLKDSNGTTDKHGIVKVTAPRRGTLKLTASHKGYIRAAAATVHVSG